MSLIFNLKFRLDDMVPFEEGIPIGSLEATQPKVTEDDEVPVKETLIPSPENNVEEVEKLPVIAVAINPEEAENEATTMFPMEMMSNINQSTSAIISKMVKASEANDETSQEDEEEDDEGKYLISESKIFR